MGQSQQGFLLKGGSAVNNVGENKKGPRNWAQHWAKDEEEDEARGQGTEGSIGAMLTMLLQSQMQNNSETTKNYHRDWIFCLFLFFVEPCERVEFCTKVCMKWNGTHEDRTKFLHLGYGRNWVS